MKACPAANRRRRRYGFSLIEMMAATTIMAVVMTSVIVVVRSGYAVWNAYEQDIDIAENAYGVLRHFVRQMRQATAVTAISAPSDTTGDLSYTTARGLTQSWSLNGGAAPEKVKKSAGEKPAPTSTKQI